MTNKTMKTEEVSTYTPSAEKHVFHGVEVVGPHVGFYTTRLASTPRFEAHARFVFHIDAGDDFSRALTRHVVDGLAGVPAFKLDIAGKGHLLRTKALIHLEWSQTSKHAHLLSVIVRVQARAVKQKDRPSTLAALMESFILNCPAGVGCDLQTSALYVIRDAIKATQDEAGALLRRHHAGEIARHLAKQADEKARKAINFEARLAALCSELETARASILSVDVATVFTDDKPHTFSGSDAVIDPRAVKAGCKNAASYLPALVKGTGGLALPLDHTITVEDVS